MSDPRSRIAIFSLLSFFLVLARPAGAVPVTVDAYDSGWILHGEYHIAANENYTAGNSDVNGWYYRNFFRFDLTGVSETVTSAVLRIHLGNLSSSDPSETYELFDAPSLTYANLNSGTSYGSREIFMTETGNVDIVLNTAAILAINTALGGLFDVGGDLNSMDADDFTNETLFGNTNEFSTRQLILNPIPEPTTALLLGIGVAGLTRYRRRSARLELTPLQQRGPFRGETPLIAAASRDRLGLFTRRVPARPGDGQKGSPVQADQLLFAALLSLVMISSGAGAASANSCADAVVLDSASLPIQEVGSTIGAGNEYEGSCVSGSDVAPDMVFQFTPAISDDYTFSTDDSGTSFDTGIYVRENCEDAFTEIACADGPGGESLTFSAQAGTTYYLFVDGAVSDEGDFVLTLILGSPPTLVPTLSWTGTALLMLLFVAAVAWSRRPNSSCA